MKHVLAIYLFFILGVCAAQNPDSLIHELNSRKHHDTTKIKLCYDISEVCEENDIEFYCEKGLLLLNKLEEKEKDKNYPFYFKQSGKLISNIAFVKNLHGDIKGAINQYYKALSHSEEAKDTTNQAIILNNLAMIFKKLGQNQKGIDLMYKAISLKKRIKNNYKTLANSYSFLGEMYESVNMPDSNVYYQNLALELRLKTKDPVAIARSYKSMGSLYMHLGELKKAEDYLLKAVNNLETSTQHRLLLESYVELGKYYKQVGNKEKSLEVFNKGWQLGNKDYFPEQLQQIAHSFYEIYHNDKQFEKALKFYQRYTHLRDSLNNSNLKEQAITANLQHQFEIAEANLKADQEKKLLLERQQQEKVKVYLIFAGILLVLMAALSIFINKRWKISKRQNAIIEKQRESLTEQHKLLQEKNNAIEESINYASVIQHSFFIQRGNVNSITGKDIMLFFKPKDVVSGDFYWFKKLGSKLYFVVADSTGHGVPGAFISLISIKAIESVFENIETPLVSQVLNKIDFELQRIIDKEHGSKAGVDLIIGCFDETSGLLDVTGSRNSIYLIKQNTLSEIKFTNYFVGNPNKYNANLQTEQLMLTKGDSIYMTTDGFTDQKGEKSKTKFFINPFRQFISKLHPLPVKEQRIAFEETFNNWKGNLPQTDDVCVIGIKV